MFTLPIRHRLTSIMLAPLVRSIHTGDDSIRAHDRLVFEGMVTLVSRKICLLVIRWPAYCSGRAVYEPPAICQRGSLGTYSLGEKRYTQGVLSHFEQ